ncbi:hypothetical protein B0T18DRAFT_440034 [Schizothecium vesticola]|uniref:Proteinase inhibitor, propeptide n=1 Tax=Schizothecium vesticola TaxID=314040 RepID=A0AA40JYU0_9PEZI|nr:hypothetical protein B0T18DRAFT_440034 [Schizothecium vesticola]
MRLFRFFLAALTLFSSALAVDIQKSVIVSYPEGTPDSVLDQAKDAIRQAGGQITHEYTLIRGFAAKCGEKVLETVTEWGTKYNALIEEDQVASAL